MKTNYIIMGVTGSGKTTIGSKLAKALKIQFLDADNFHPMANIKKMESGVPLDDGDRLPWLSSLRDRLSSSDGCVLACSALKESYRSILADVPQATLFIHLIVSRETAIDRVASRPGHFMPADLVESQFCSLEKSLSALAIDAESPEESVLKSVLSALDNCKKNAGDI